jgi:hypothetical protein
MRLFGALGGLALAMTALTSAAAQRVDDVRAGVARSRVKSQLAPVASAIVPGMGQLMQGRHRALAYFAVEVVGWWKLARDVQDRADEVGEFKDLARRIARAHFDPTGPDGDWQYYEAMRDNEESGVYTKVPGSVVPEDRLDTFNGKVWDRALGTTPDSAAALDLYKQQAYKPEMLWSWRNAGFQFDSFVRATELKNNANNAVNADIAVIVLNHVISMIDAYSVFRLETHRLPDGRTAVGGRLTW